MAGKFQYVSVANVATPIIGGTPSRNITQYWGGHIKWAAAKDIVNAKGRYIYSTKESISQKGIDNSAAKVLPKGTIIITARGTVGVLAQLGEEMAFNQTCYALVSKENVIPSYLYYAMKGSLSEMQTLSYGTVFATITIKSFDHLTIPLPSIPEQHAIAHILGTLDDKIELNRKTNKTLEAMARAIFKSWFIDFDPVHAKAEGRDPGLPEEIADLFPDSFEKSELGEIPMGWRVVTLPEVIEINPLRSLQKGTDAPYLDMANVPSNSARVNKVIKRLFGSGTKFMNGDTLLARITPCLENGKTAFVDFLEHGQVGCGSTEFIVLRPKKPLPPVFGYFLARDPEFRAFAISNMSGTSGRQRVPSDCFNNYKLVMPEDSIGVAFGKHVGTIMQQLRVNDEQSFTLSAIRDTLLPKLLSGEIRVKDAEKFGEAAV